MACAIETSVCQKSFYVHSPNASTPFSQIYAYTRKRRNWKVPEGKSPCWFVPSCSTVRLPSAICSHIKWLVSCRQLGKKKPAWLKSPLPFSLLLPQQLAGYHLSFSSLVLTAEVGGRPGVSSCKPSSARFCLTIRFLQSMWQGLH